MGFAYLTGFASKRQATARARQAAGCAVGDFLNCSRWKWEIAAVGVLTNPSDFPLATAPSRKRLYRMGVEFVGSSEESRKSIQL